MLRQLTHTAIIAGFILAACQPPQSHAKETEPRIPHYPCNGSVYPTNGEGVVPTEFTTDMPTVDNYCQFVVIHTDAGDIVLAIGSANYMVFARNPEGQLEILTLKPNDQTPVLLPCGPETITITDTTGGTLLVTIGPEATPTAIPFDTLPDGNTTQDG
ncbi:MAG: hypothetical protein AAB909_02505 [Patescibacteria group bacterium]